jgi:hypothetical protein
MDGSCMNKMYVKVVYIIHLIAKSLSGSKWKNIEATMFEKVKEKYANMHNMHHIN